MDIGLDVHGCIDKYPELFAKLSKEWAKNGHRIHIITGNPWANVKDEVDGYGITYHEHYSIVDFNKEAETPMWDNDPRSKGWWMKEKDWLRSKGDYCFYSRVLLHFDDSIEYKEYFPKNCRFVHMTEDFVDNWAQWLDV